MEEERLLGVSLTGIMDHKIMSGQVYDTSDWSGSPELNTLEKVLSHIRDYCREVNKEWAAKIGISASGHVTCVKPSGCTTMETKVRTDKGDMSLQNIWDKYVDVNSGLKDNGKWYDLKEKLMVYDCDNTKREVTKFFDNGVSIVYNIEDEFGNTYKFTGNHKLLTTNRGWVKVEDLDIDDDIKSF